jgi:hypothetical protein
VDRAAEAAQAWHDNDLVRTLGEVARYTGIQQELKTGGDELRAKLRELTRNDRLEAFQRLGDVLRTGSAGAAEITNEQRACWGALALLLDFRRREMDARRLAQTDALSQDAERLEAHLSNRDIPFRDRADGLGAFVKRIEGRVTDLHARIASARAEYGARLDNAGLPVAVLDVPAEALLVLTKRDQMLERTTKGIMPAETLIHHLVRRNLKNAERCVEIAERRLDGLQRGCDEWMREWEEVRKEVQSLARESDAHQRQIEELNEGSGDSLFVKTHLRELRSKLNPLWEDAADLLEGLQALIDGDYAEQVRARDQGGVPYDQNDTAVLLTEARRLLAELKTAPQVSIARLRERLEPLARARAEYASALMDERGTPSDPGLGLLRFAIGRLDNGAPLRAQQRLSGATALRAVVEEAAKLREEWRREGPNKLGDPGLFEFFLEIINDTNLGNQPIPAATDWEKLGKLKDRNLLSLKLA